MTRVAPTCRTGHTMSQQSDPLDQARGCLLVHATTVRASVLWGKEEKYGEPNASEGMSQRGREVSCSKEEATRNAGSR